MRASASAGARAISRSALIGEKADLTYPYDYLGAGPETLAELGNGKFAEALKTAERPLVHRRRRRAGAAGWRARSPRSRQKRAVDFGAVKDGWNGFSVLHSAASRVGALDLGLVPGEGGLMPPQMAAGGARRRCSCSAPTRSRSRPALSLSISARMATAARTAPTSSCRARPIRRNPAIYVNTEGRVQMANRAAFPPGDAREDWAILRALSDALGHKLPYDSLAQLRQALFKAHPHLMRHRPDRGRRCGRHQRSSPSSAAAATKRRSRSPVTDFYFTNPIARASAMMAECSALAHAAAKTAAE